jgi:hypothetical protein
MNDGAGTGQRPLMCAVVSSVASDLLEKRRDFDFHCIPLNFGEEVKYGIETLFNPCLTSSELT